MLFVLPSLHEGLGIVLIEAQTSGLNSYTSDIVVPKEANISNSLEYINLDKIAKYWADKSQITNTKNRSNSLKEIIIKMKPK